MSNMLNFLFQQKKLALVFTLSIIVIGALASISIQRDRFPAVDLEQMYINTYYPNSSPEDVEQGVTNVIEDAIKNIYGIDIFTSISEEGWSTIIINLSQDVDDIDIVKQDIRTAVNSIKSLPSEISEMPRVIDVKMSIIEVLQVNINSANLPYDETLLIVDNMQKALEDIAGVAEVVKEGYLEQEVKIYIDPDKLVKYKISLERVINAIRARNKRYTVGNNNDSKQEKNIVVLAKFDNPDSISDVVVKSTFDGPVIYLGDIAKIVKTKEQEKSILRVNGSKGFILRIKKQENADVIKTVDLVKATISKLEKKYPQEVKIFYTNDLSKHVRNRLGIVANNGIIGLILVLVVLGAFLTFRTAFWVAASLPVSLLGTVAILAFMGETINLISLAAMILVLGLVVDDSIVVAESIHSFKEKGKDLTSSIVAGFKRVIMPVIITILTSILAMSSMFLMGGTIGKFVYIIPLVVIFALGLSLLEVVFALPAHLSFKTKQVQRSWFKGCENIFERFIYKILRFRYLVFVAFISLLLFSFYFATANMSFNLFPTKGADNIYVNAELAIGSSLESTEEVAKKMEQRLIAIVDKDLDFITTKINPNSHNIIKFRISLQPSNSRLRGFKDILDLLKAANDKNPIKEIEKINFTVARPGPPQGKDVEVVLISDNDEQRMLAVKKVEQILNKTTGVSSIDRDDKLGKPRIEVVLDYDKMARIGVDFAKVKSYLQAAFSGINVTDMRYFGKDLNFRIYLGSGEQSEKIIDSLSVSNRTGQLVPMSNFSSLKYIAGEPNFNHFNGTRSIVISASVDDKLNTTAKVMEQINSELDADNIFPAVKVMAEGGAKENQQSLENFQKAFVMAIGLIFLLLVVLFNSYSQPLLVLTAIPFSLVGVIWAFYFHAEDLSFFALMGSLALVGVIVNDSLVLVNHLNHIKAEKLTIEARKWVAKGARQRLRAVVLTSLTTLAGVLPLAYGIGGVDYFLQPMVLALGYGLLFGTFVTLILLPCLYLMNYEFINWLDTFKARITKKRRVKTT